MGLQRDIPDQSPPLTPVGFNECLTQVVWALQGPLYGGEQNREVPSPEAFGSVCVVHNTMINERASQPMWGFLTLNSGRADNHPSGADIVLPVTKSEMPTFIYCTQNRHFQWKTTLLLQKGKAESKSLSGWPLLSMWSTLASKGTVTLLALSSHVRIHIVSMSQTSSLPHPACIKYLTPVWMLSSENTLTPLK